MSLNCAGFKAHFKDLRADHTLLKGDIIHLFETSLKTMTIRNFLYKDNQTHFIMLVTGKALLHTIKKINSRMTKI